MSDDKKREMPRDVAGLMENAFLMGIGMLEFTRDKANEMADELIERGKMSQSEAKHVADRISEVATKQQETFRSTVASETDRAMKNAGVATKSEIELLRTEIAELKALIANMKAESGPTE